MYPDSLKKLIESFKYLPGVGEKTAERYAYSILDLEEEQVELFEKSLIAVSENIHKCPVCSTYTDLDLCYICNDKNRDNSLIVVEDSKNVFLLEKLRVFHGKYHVLNGLISPLDGINPDDIGLEKLIDRITKEKFEEVIFAFKPSIEGETTALYIKRILEGMHVKITRLASGLPMGADMEYVDGLTLERAMFDRKEIM